MSKSWQSIYTVDTKIKPMHYRYRRPVDLHVGAMYYLSFGSNKATICKLIEIVETGSDRRIISIEIVIKKKPKDITFPTVKHSLSEDEIGNSPEEAVKHQVTS